MTDYSARVAYAGVRAAFKKHIASKTLEDLCRTRKNLEHRQQYLHKVLTFNGYQLAGLSAEAYYEIHLATPEEIV